jgi:hypothetical protein
LPRCLAAQLTGQYWQRLDKHRSIERFHKTLRAEFLDGKLFAGVEEAQAALDAWVDDYNHRRPHQSIGKVPPFERFQLAAVKPGPVETTETDPAIDPGAVTTRRVNDAGTISFAATSYRVGSKYRRRQVQVAVVADTVEISVGNQLICSHQVRHDRTREHGALANPGGRPHRINAA